MSRLEAPLRAIARRARLRRHQLAAIAAVRAMHATAGDDFDRAREHATELALCPDPEHCDHLG